eukprot:3593446-Rhodomonas_salina.1
METTQEQESKKQIELLEKLIKAEAALEANTQKLRASQQTIQAMKEQEFHASQQTIQAIKEQESAIQSADRKLCTAMKERIYGMARRVGEASYDWNICCASIEKMAEEREAFKIMTDKVFAMAAAIGEDPGDLNKCFVAIESASASHTLCKAMKEQIFKIAIPLGEKSTDWEQSMLRIAHTVERASASQIDIDILTEKVAQAAVVLGLEADAATLDPFFAHIPQLRAEQEVWTSAKERIVRTAGMLGAGSTPLFGIMMMMTRRMMTTTMMMSILLSRDAPTSIEDVLFEPES